MDRFIRPLNQNKNKIEFEYYKNDNFDKRRKYIPYYSSLYSNYVESSYKECTSFKKDIINKGYECNKSESNINCNNGYHIKKYYELSHEYNSYNIYRKSIDIGTNSFNKNIIVCPDNSEMFLFLYIYENDASYDSIQAFKCITSSKKSNTFGNEEIYSICLLRSCSKIMINKLGNSILFDLETASITVFNTESHDPFFVAKQSYFIDNLFGVSSHNTMMLIDHREPNFYIQNIDCDTNYYNRIVSLSWNALDTQYLAMGTGNGDCYIFDIRKFNKELNVLRNKENIRISKYRTKHNNASVCSIDWHPTQSNILCTSSGFENPEVKIWNINENDNLYKNYITIPQESQVLNVHWINDDNIITTLGRGGRQALHFNTNKILLWDIHKKQNIKTQEYKNPILHSFYRKNSNNLITFDYDNPKASFWKVLKNNNKNKSPSSSSSHTLLITSKRQKIR
jgi:hypothetical protein